MKKLIITIIMFSSLLLLAGCGKTEKNDIKENENIKTEDNNSNNNSDNNSDENSSMKPSGEKLTVGILPAESSIPIILAKEKGFFDDLGLSVTIQAFSSPNDRNVAVQAKELDGTIADVMTEAAFKENGLNMKITSDINEDFKILSSPESGITEMKGLNGKSVSLVPNFILEYIMDKFAEENNFSYEIVEIPSFSGRAEALISNQIDGVVFTEPQAGMLVSQGAHLLGSSKEAGIKGGTILFTDTVINDRPGDIKAFYEAYNKAVDYINSTDVSEYLSILTDYQFPEAIGNYLSSMPNQFQYAGIIDENRFNDIISWTQEKGQISKAYTYDELTDFSFIQ